MKFHITDEEGKSFEVEEVEEENAPTTDEEPEEIVLSKEDILAIKSLLPHIEKLKALVAEKEDVSDDEEEKEIVGEEAEKAIHEDDEDIDEDVEEDKDEEIVDTDEDEDEDKDPIHDSIGAISKNKASTNDALDAQLDIDSAWAKRFNGGNE